MLNKGQKRLFKFISIISFILAVIAVIPFRTFYDGGYILDLVVKFIAFPLLIILISYKANRMKYQEIAENRTRSKVINFMSYYPMVIYLVGLLLGIFQTLSMGDEAHPAYSPLGIVAWGLIQAFVVALTVLLIVFLCGFVNKIVMEFDKNKTIIFDSVIAGFLVIVIIASFIVTKAYHHYFSELEFYSRGNEWLLGMLVLGFIFFFIVTSKIFKLIDVDEVLIRVDVNELNSKEPSKATIDAEYENAYRKVKAQYEAKINKIQEDYMNAFDKVYTEYNMVLNKFILEHKNGTVSPEEKVETPTEEAK